MDLAITFKPDVPLLDDQSYKLVRAADDAGIHSVWVPEKWGIDCFSVLSLLALRTRRLQLGSAIVNVYSRTPAALAQHYATIDLLSGGRAVAGLGTSGHFVVEHLFGMAPGKPLGSLRNAITIIRTLLAGQPVFLQDGKLRDLGAGFRLDMPLARPAVPFFVAALHPASIRLAGELAQGVLPIDMPVDNVAAYVAAVRAAATAAGREPGAVVIRSPGRVIVTSDPEAAVLAAARSAAYRIAMMGESQGNHWYSHWCRMGYQDVAETVKNRWYAEGWQSAVQALPESVRWGMHFAGSVEACKERLAQQAAAGIDLHIVDVVGHDEIETARILEKLAS